LKNGPYPDTIGTDFRPKHILNIAAWHAARATSQDKSNRSAGRSLLCGCMADFFAGDQNRSLRIENLFSTPDMPKRQQAISARVTGDFGEALMIERTPSEFRNFYNEWKKTAPLNDSDIIPPKPRRSASPIQSRQLFVRFATGSLVPCRE
jgi:hypothetical protein